MSVFTAYLTQFWGTFNTERGGDRKDIKYFKRRIAAVNSLSLEMAIWKIDQFHPLALHRACTESPRDSRDGWEDCDCSISTFIFPGENTGHTRQHVGVTFEN